MNERVEWKIPQRREVLLGLGEAMQEALRHTIRDTNRQLGYDKIRKNRCVEA